MDCITSEHHIAQDRLLHEGELLISNNVYCMEFVFLPTYSPNLNLIEKLWWLMRKHMTRNQFYLSLKALCEAIVEWLEKLPFAQFCSLMGIDENDLVFV